MNRKILVLICVFILSRTFFINPFPIFFDSPEYLARFSNVSYINAIASGHLPFHIGYMIIFWPIFHLANFFRINPPYAVIFIQIILSAAAVYCFYRSIEVITNKRVAEIAAVICSLTPLYWTINESIMVESTYINLFLISLFFLTQYAKSKIHSNLFLLLGCSAFGLGLLTNPIIILWTPLLFFVTSFMRGKEAIKLLTSFSVTLLISLLISSYFIAHALRLSIFDAMSQYLFGVDIKFIPYIPSVLIFLRFIRNAAIPLFQSNTSIILVLSIISLVKLFKNNKRLFTASCLWIFPAALSYQLFDPLLFGRHGVISIFGFAFLAAIILEKRKILFYTTIIYLVLVSVPTLLLLKQPIPYLETSKFVKTLPQGLLVETHFARPQIEGNYSGQIMFINHPGWSKRALEETIDSDLNRNKPVFITSQALSDPYGIYSGPFLYPLSLSYAKMPELADVIPSYRLEKYVTIDKLAGLSIYKIVSKEKFKYPEIPRLNNNRRQIIYFDPINQLLLFIERAKIIQSQSIIKG